MTADRHCVITLTTDFGMEDGNVGVMKGVIYGINPAACIVDLSHDIAPQNIADAAYVLRRAYGYFPQDTIHVVVVDPGVGSGRQAIAVQSGQAFFVAPDNGVLTYVLQELRERGERSRIINLTNPAYWLPQVSNVFHGRDIFAPVAAHLSLGVEIGALGEEIEDVMMLSALRLEMRRGRIRGQVAHIDHFGNLLTNIPESDLISLGVEVTVRIAETEIGGLSKTFAQGQAGELIAYIDSSGHLAMAVVNGSAQQLLKCHVGESVEVAALQDASLQQEAL
jgi:S-adenosylmethionine hydrolase